MLGRKNFTKEELNHARSAVDEQLAAYKKVAKGVDKEALASFESVYFNNMVLVLDRYFVHRVRLVTGKDQNALNEVELLAESLMNNAGVLASSTVIKIEPKKSVLKLDVGDAIKLTAGEFERLSSAFLAEIEERFL